jgi:ATP-dependent Clp protease ATP-binding subunit ClpC
MAFEDESDDNLNDPIYKKGSSKTPFLDQYSRDLTEMAIRGEIDPIIGREEEIEREKEQSGFDW